MAAPHVDNPYGAKGAKGKNEDLGKDKDNGKNNGKNKAQVNIGQSDSDSDLPKCAHPFCNEPSDPANFPVGLPWASGLLKCLPGYCTKHRKESIAEITASVDVGEEMELNEFVKYENVCKCKDPPPSACPPHKELLKKGKTNECSKPYPKYIYPDDQCVDQELCFFLRMMMVGDEMDRWEEEDRKKEREEAKKRQAAKKKKNAKSTKSEDKGKESKTGSKGKKKKLKGDGKPKNDEKQADETLPENETREISMKNLT